MEASPAPFSLHPLLPFHHTKHLRVPFMVRVGLFLEDFAYTAPFAENNFLSTGGSFA